MKVGIEFKIDVTKIDKSKIFEGKKGKYLSMTAFVDTEKEDQYKWQGVVNHSNTNKDDGLPVLGNAKIFWIDGQGNQKQPKQQVPQQNNSFADSFDDDIPF